MAKCKGDCFLQRKKANTFSKCIRREWGKFESFNRAPFGKAIVNIVQFLPRILHSKLTMELNKARNIIGIRVLNDNVIWLWVKNKSVVVVDPSVHEPVIRYIDENNFHLKAILQTHHHSDHIGGT